MNIQNNNETQSPVLIYPRREFHYGSAVGGFVIGLVMNLMLFGLVIGVASGGGVGPAGGVVLVIVGLVSAIVSPFAVGYWIGKTGFSSGNTERRNETHGLESHPRLWYGTRGRINRKGFLTVQVVAWSLLLIGIAAMPSGLISWPLGIAAIGIYISSLVRRLHDLGFSGWFAVMSLIPYVGQISSIPLFIVPGNSRLNKYGAQPQGIEVAAVSPGRPG